MTGPSALELDALWQEFHEVVNMTSQELAHWLESRPAGERTAVGEGVLALLQKSRAELREEDLQVMYAVVDTVEHEGADGLDGPGGREKRHRLMAVGHDPLRPTGPPSSLL
ncbi:DUF3140 domain-containing protein [Streptomyces sp. NPDC059506]|uniref:DUF3140 domain-containing protein n=1 Tax=unclassified Streptomyces TaxID=2593676 RepID=UPI000CC202B7|nr:MULTISPECIES: DUF3140 domain-containing protein [unclassified Streptomyces]MCZ2526036.1 DUF3140 domain-containing protein [Streptomyces sp. HB2AG]PLW66404.1 hypothetical protein C0036_22935 [Streptomyces sp. DJ]QMV23016.1 DUF3140 domain-containing protein [Streptomyces sp. SCUT-3]